MHDMDYYREKIKKGIYRHFKGNLYEVKELAYDSEDMSVLVVYRALYGEGDTWVRKADMWCECIERDGRCVPRFEFVGESEKEL